MLNNQRFRKYHMAEITIKLTWLRAYSYAKNAFLSLVNVALTSHFKKLNFALTHFVKILDHLSENWLYYILYIGYSIRLLNYVKLFEPVQYMLLFIFYTKSC